VQVVRAASQSDSTHDLEGELAPEAVDGVAPGVAADRDDHGVVRHLSCHKGPDLFVLDVSERFVGWPPSPDHLHQLRHGTYSHTEHTRTYAHTEHAHTHTHTHLQFARSTVSTHSWQAVR
jgi:hypothetical protein